MITNLMREENFVNVTRDDGQPLNVSKARIWFEVIKLDAVFKRNHLH